MSTGVIGGAPAYLLLRRLGSHIAEQERGGEQAPGPIRPEGLEPHRR